MGNDQYINRKSTLKTVTRRKENEENISAQEAPEEEGARKVLARRRAKGRKMLSY